MILNAPRLIPTDVLRYVGAQSVSYPPEFEIHSHLKKHHVENRLKRLESGTGIDWGSAEALAIGSLLYQVSYQSSKRVGVQALNREPQLAFSGSAKF